MLPGDHYKAARQISLALSAIREVAHWCRTIRAEREVLKCAKSLSRTFERDFPNMRNPYMEIPKDV